MSVDESWAEAWVETKLMPIIRSESDGGLTLMRVIVDAIFFETALFDLNEGTNRAAGLMTVVHRALTRAHVP